MEGRGGLVISRNIYNNYLIKMKYLIDVKYCENSFHRTKTICFMLLPEVDPNILIFVPLHSHTLLCFPCHKKHYVAVFDESSEECSTYIYSVPCAECNALPPYEPSQTKISQSVNLILNAIGNNFFD